MQATRPAVNPWVSVIAGLLALAALFAWRPQTRPTSLLRDFNAFYCAGQTLVRSADPYRAEPLGTCERAGRAPLASSLPGLATPAPLPPYALFPFALLARLPYAAAAALWSLLLLGATALSMAALWRLTGLPAAACVAALALGEGYASLCLGQLAPIAIAGIALATLFAERQRYGAAALAAAAATIEPHVGLPACLVLFICRPAARIPLACAGLTLGALSLAAAGIATNLEYLRAVLPAHALSEVVNEKQLSATYLLHRLGASDHLALQGGDLWYGAMIVTAAFAAPRLARVLHGDGAVVALPAALAVTGGPFVHIVQMPAAMPLAFLLFARVPRLRRIAGFAIVALAIPWMQFVTLGTVFPLLAAVAAGAFVWNAGGRSPFAAMGTALAALCYSAVSTMLFSVRVPSAEGLLRARYDPHALAEASWNAYVHAVATWNVPAYDVARLPTLVGIAIVAFGALAVAFARTAEPVRSPAASAGKGIRAIHESV